ncbi:MAG: hypothetical protein BWZ10_02827 [candidate division BRC1 bacterium ADurb.BinA364]|nr:MAG: hypothetical protein BWZ10_02827 [candidate division BRC1 bacterium ADurb.BinA364]
MRTISEISCDSPEASAFFSGKMRTSMLSASAMSRSASSASIWATRAAVAVINKAFVRSIEAIFESFPATPPSVLARSAALAYFSGMIFMISRLEGSVVSERSSGRGMTAALLA